jgi:hypothetical protein
MTNFGSGEYWVPVIRTDYTDDAAWTRLREAVVEPSDEGFEANVDFVEDATLDGVSDIGSVLPSSYQGSFVFVVDQATMTDPAHPILVLDVRGTRGDPFRCTPRGVQAVSNNLSMANMGWHEFAQVARQHGGVFDHF